MHKAIRIARVTYVMLAVIVLGLALSCGGGTHRSVGTLPSVSSSSGGSSHASFGQVDRRACVPEDEIYRLSPIMQELYGDPGWKGPATPIPASTPVPAPLALNIEDVAARCEGTTRLNRDEEPVVPVRGVSHEYIPPDDPGYYPMPGEYDEDDWNGTGDPPWGSDGDDEDIYEDRIQRVDQFDEQARSFVKEGSTRPNQFNRGTMEVGTLTAVYQTYDIPTGLDPEWGEWSYPSEDTYDVVTEPAYFVGGYIYDKLQMSTTVRRYSQMVDFAWYDILIAPLDDVSTDYMSTQPPNETYASYQPYFFDDETLLYGEAWMVELTLSSNDYIQELIDLQVADDMPVVTYPIFGIIQQRWADDVWNMGVDPPWEGPLGWPLSDPFIDRGGRLLTGPLGPYYRYGQYFEKGFMWHVDYMDPEMPDEVYVYRYDEDSTLDPGGEYVQDPTVVKYGMGGPLGCNVVVNPLVANVGDPIFFKAFPYGGPVDNANGFADDWFLWNFRDGTVSGGSIQFPIHEYYVEARYVARLMFSLDYDGDGNPDGDTEGYKVFADSPEIEIGHLGEPGGGGGGAGEPTILLVQDDTGGYDYKDSLQHVQAFQNDLDALDLSSAYDTVTTTDISGVSDMEDYLCVIWCPARLDWFSPEQIDSRERALIMSYVQSSGGNVILPSNALNNGWGGNPAWHTFMGSQWNSAYMSGPTYMSVAGTPIGSGPGGTIGTINRTNMWQSMASSLQPNTTVIGRWSSVNTAISRDHDTGNVGGRMTTIATVWHHFSTTSPATPGRSGLLKNLLNWIDPQILIVEEGPGGEDPILPYDGPVDIADVFAWLYAEDGSEITGGDGDTPEDQVEIWVLLPTDPQSVWFECLARTAGEPDSLIYEWSFEPGDPFSIWTRYTAHWYDGGIDPDGEGPLEDGDEFDVWARVYDSDVAPSYDLAPPDARDIDSVKIKVHGPPPIDIRDDGTVIEGSYAPDEFGDVTVPLDFWVEGGVPPYDNVYIDYDYDFITFDEPPAAGTVEVTPTPGEGHTDYDLVISGVTAGDEYYIAIRAYDTEAPNDYDTYVWIDPVTVGSPVLVIDDRATAGAMGALTSDLAAIGLTYDLIDTASTPITDVSQLEGSTLVIWHCQDNASSYNPGSINATEKQVIIDYFDGGGNALFILPYEYSYYMGGSTDYNWLRDYWNISLNQSPYCYLYGYYSYYYYYYDNSRTFNGARSGPGGTCDFINYGKSPYPQHSLYIYNYYNRIPSNRRLIQWGQYYAYYLKSYYHVTVGGGNNVVYGGAWHDTNSSSMTGTRSGLLRNLIEVADPDLM